MAAAEAAALRVPSAPVLRARLRLAGLLVSLDLEGCPEAFAALEAHRAAGDSSETAAEPALALHLRAFPGLPPKLDHVSFEDRGDRLFCDGDGLRGEVAAARARLDVFGGEPALFAALRLCCALWLAPRGGLLLHGACVEVPGPAALALLGQSGAGKSTVSRRLQRSGVRVISDEVTAVRVSARTAKARQPVVHGHPFPRRLGDGRAGDAGLPLAALGFLWHARAGEAPSATALTPASAARALLARVFLPVRSPALVAAALASCERLAEAVPAHALRLSNDDRDAGCVLSLREAAR